MYKVFKFECGVCQHLFSEMVYGVDGLPEICPECGQAEGFKKILSCPALLKTIVADYPGSKRLKAGYTHTHARPAEKSNSQVSMHLPKGK